MQHYERMDPENQDILSITRLGHLERYKLATKLIPHHSVVLDAACGCGYGTEMLSRKSSLAIGIDRDPDSINLCKQKYKMNRSIDFLVSNVGELPFDDSFFDSVVGMEMIEHIENPERFASEAHRVLKHNGSLLISTPYGDNTLLPDGKPFSQYHVTEYTQKEIEEMLQDYGFDVVQTYGQYIILGTIMKLTDNKVEPISNVKAGGTQSLMEKIPFFAKVFSKHYPILKSTSKNMFYHAVRRN